jgi:tetrapyrrole methylase family protein/MazG family protein
VDGVLAALEWDALDGVQMTDAMEVARRHFPPLDPDRPALVAQIHSRLVASDVKLVLLAAYPPEHEVHVVRIGGQEAACETFPLA